MLEYPILTLLVIAPFAEKVQQAERQRQAVEAIREVGGFVGYDYEMDESGFFWTKQEPPGPAWLRRLVGDDFVSDVVNVDFSDTRVTDAGVENLNELTGITHLALGGTQVSDAGLENLTGLANLTLLGLSHTQVSDTGLKHLVGLTNLQVLGLVGTHATEEGIMELRKALPKCQIYWDAANK